MDNNFDLDINNYSVNDLIKFFRLENTFSLEDLIKKEEELAREILTAKDSKYKDSKYKFDIVSFIKSGKDALTNFLNEIKTIEEMQKQNIDKFVNKDKNIRVGKIINPLAPHQALERAIIPEENINGYGYNTTTSVYVFNTITRNDYFKTASSFATFELPVKWKDVISISLASTIIPNVMYAFNNDAGTNQIFIEEDGTGLSALVTLPEGNYTPYAGNITFANIVEVSFPDTLEAAINEQVLGITVPALYRFKVTIDLATRKTIISNTTNTFKMNVLKKDPNVKCSPFANTILIDYNKFAPNKKDANFEAYLETMGYLMGFRELEYSGKKSYTSESIFTNVYSNYLFFVLEDFTGSQTISTTYGILGSNSVLDGNILAIIPINSGAFSTTFDSNANFIFKKREYFGPVDISRIAVKLINQKGRIVNLQQTDFNFSLQVNTIYNLTTTFKMRGTTAI